MKCRYCTTFYAASDRKKVFITEEKFLIERFCRVKIKYVFGEDTSCPDFSLAKTFWCDKDNMWLDVVVCIHRQNTQRCKCTQGRDILGASRRKEGTVNNLVRRERPSANHLKRRSA